MNVQTFALSVAALLAWSAGAASAASPASFADAAKPVTGLLYVSHSVSHPNEVAIYRQNGGDFVGRITNGIDVPIGMAVDAAGTLYVANVDGPDVTIYPAGRRSPSLVLSDGLRFPISVTVDANKTVYVVDGPGAIVEYLAGHSHPFLRIPPYRGSGEVSPEDLAVDASGDIFLSATFGTSFGEDILEYPVGPSSSWQRLHIYPPLRNLIDGLAFDRSGLLVFAESAGASSEPGGIFVYDVAQRKVVRTIGRQFDGYTALRFDRGLNRLFAVNLGQRVFVYDYASGTFIRSIFVGGSEVDGIAVGPS